MKPVYKVVIVAGGYLLAFPMACAAVALHVAFTSGSIGQASSGMSAFGDMVLFVIVFGAGSVIPTGAGFYFLLSKKKIYNQTAEPIRRSRDG